MQYLFVYNYSLLYIIYKIGGVCFIFNSLVLDTIKQHNLFLKGEHIIVGVSGGADSIALLHFLNQIKDDFNLNITAVNINHLIRGEESDLDTNFVIDFCKNLNIDLKCFSYDIKKEAKKLGLSIEETARIFRYNAFEEVRLNLNANKIAVAHNKNDNAETLLMRFFRGTGAKGLSGIPPKRNFIIRPFLNCDRSLIEKYCKENNILFRNDSTNFLDIYTRNKVRLSTIPYIQQNFNPNIINTITSMSNNFKEEDLFLDELANNYLKDVLVLNLNKNLDYLNALDKNIFIINTTSLLNLNIVIQKRIIRIIISKLTNNSLYNISTEHINSIIVLLKSNKNNKNKILNLPQNLNIYLENNLLYIYIKKSNALNINYNININYSYELVAENIVFIKEIKKYFLLSDKPILDLKSSFETLHSEQYKKILKNLTKVYTIILNYDKIKNVIFLRQKVDGDKILLNGMNKKLKNLFINNKIPVHERYKYPVLIDNENTSNIIAVAGLFVSDLYKPYKNNIYLYIWEEN